MHFYSKNAFSKQKLFLNTLELYLLERHVFWQKKSCNFEHGLETKNEFEKWPLITFFQCTCNFTQIERKTYSILKFHEKFEPESFICFHDYNLGYLKLSPCEHSNLPIIMHYTLNFIQVCKQVK